MTGKGEQVMSITLEDRARLTMASVGHELNMVIHDDVLFGKLSETRTSNIFISHSFLQSQFADHLI